MLVDEEAARTRVLLASMLRTCQARRLSDPVVDQRVMEAVAARDKVAASHVPGPPPLRTYCYQRVMEAVAARDKKRAASLLASFDTNLDSCRGLGSFTLWHQHSTWDGWNG